MCVLRHKKMKYLISISMKLSMSYHKYLDDQFSPNRKIYLKIEDSYYI